MKKQQVVHDHQEKEATQSNIKYKAEMLNIKPDLIPKGAGGASSFPKQPNEGSVKKKCPSITSHKTLHY